MRSQKNISNDALEAVKEVFKSKAKGFKNVKNTKEIITILKSKGVNIKATDLRYIIGFLRRNDAFSPSFIISDVTNGYWLSDDPKEQNMFLEKQLYRMVNQYDNLQELHKRLRTKISKSNEIIQAGLF